MFKSSECHRTAEEREIGLSANSFVRGFRALFFTCLISFLFVPHISGAVMYNADGSVAGGMVTQQFGAYATEEVPGTEGMTEMQVISTLKKDIQLLDEEISACNRKRKGWTAATIVGGVGVVGTGVAALVQNSNRKEKKAEIEKVSGQINSTQMQINAIK